MITGLAVVAALLAPAAAQDSKPNPLKINHEKGKFELTLPDGHVLKETQEQALYSYERALGSAEWEWLRVSITVGNDRVPQEGLPSNPRLIPALSQLPGAATLKRSPLPWKGVDILGAEYTFIEEKENLETFGFAAVVPLTPRAIMIDVRAAKVYEHHVRQDLTSILSSIQGTTDWLTPEEVKKLKYLIWPGIVAVVLAASYLVVWMIFFLGSPWRAHGFRVGWLLTVGILFFSGFMLSITFGDILEKGGRTAPFLCRAWIALPGMLCYTGLAFRRIMLYIEG